MKRKILVTTDLSELSTQAFPVVNELIDSSTDETEIVLLCVLEDIAKTSVSFAMGFTMFDLEGVHERIFLEATDKIGKLAEEHFAGKNVNPVVLPAVDTISRSIVDYADSQKVSMIAMASHGHTGIKGLVLGSVTERLLKLSKIPVLVVPSSS